MTITATSDNQIRKSNIRNWTIGLQTFATGSLPRSGLVQRKIMEICDPLASLAFDVRRCHDWRPAGNFALNQYREWLLTSCGLGRYIGAEIEQTVTHARVIQCLVDGIAERVANRLRRALGGKQRKPRCRLKFWQ